VTRDNTLKRVVHVEPVSFRGLMYIGCTQAKPNIIGLRLITSDTGVLSSSACGRASQPSSVISIDRKSRAPYAGPNRAQADPSVSLRISFIFLLESGGSPLSTHISLVSNPEPVQLLSHPNPPSLRSILLPRSLSP
jgi:hypothetical protein